MKQLLFSAYAQDDLLKIARYIALDSPIRARSFVAELRKQCELIAQFFTLVSLSRNMQKVYACWHTNVTSYFSQQPTTL